MADDTESELAILVCSANVGNAEPTPESFGEWVPDDGEIEGPLAQTKYPVEADGAAEVSASFSGTRKKFDIIVIGMQEAAFVDKSMNKHRSAADLSDSNRSGEDCNGNKLFRKVVHANMIARGCSAESGGGVVDAVNDGLIEAKKEGSKGKHKIFRKVAKTNLLLRGLTTSQSTYKS